MFEQFVKERIYLKNVSPRTVDFYWDCWNSFKRYGMAEGQEISKQGLNDYVVEMRKAGVKPVSCNTYISGMNAYLRWLHEHEKPLLKIQKLKVEQTVIKPLPEFLHSRWNLLNTLLGTIAPMFSEKSPTCR